MDTLLDFALKYARAGYSVLPLRGKIPLTAHGSHDASTDEATICAWWQRWPTANIGMTLEGLVVADVDPRNGGSVSALGVLPSTCNAKTGGGGWHYLFKARPGARYAGALGHGIDGKSGRGAYIVVAPSVHASGERYAWLTSPLSAALAQAPAWMETSPAVAKRQALPCARSKHRAAEWIVMADDDIEPRDNPTAERVAFNAWTNAALARA